MAAQAGDVVQRLEENHVGLVRLLGAPNGQVVDSPELVSTCIPGAPLFYNQVARARFASVTGARQVASALAPFREAQQRLVWSLPPSSAPENLNELLDAEGLLPDAQMSRGMVVRMAALRGPEPVEGMEVRAVSDLGSLKTWVDTFAEGFAVPATNRAAFVEATLAQELQIGITTSGYRRYVASIEGDAVAVCATHLAKRTVGVYRVTTLESWRGRGIARAMVWRAVRDARGGDLAVLRCTDEVAPVYARLGFGPVCDMPNYVAPPAWI